MRKENEENRNDTTHTHPTPPLHVKATKPI